MLHHVVRVPKHPKWDVGTSCELILFLFQGRLCCACSDCHYAQLELLLSWNQFYFPSILHPAWHHCLAHISGHTYESARKVHILDLTKVRAVLRMRITMKRCCIFLVALRFNGSICKWTLDVCESLSIYCATQSTWNQIMTHLREARQKNALNTKAFSDPPTQRKKSLLKEHFCTPSHFSLYGLTSYLMMSVECNSNCKLEKSVS